MTAPYTGGHAITSMHWEEPQTLRVVFTSTYASAYQYQLYVNRTLNAVTENTTDRSLLAYIQPSDWPQEIQLLAVSPTAAGTDYGSSLPPRPYNQVKLQWTTSGWTDAELIEVTAGTEPGGAVDDTNVIHRVQFDTNRAYELITSPLPGTGTWNFEITGVDDTDPDGNRGTAGTVSAGVYAHPPDVVYQDDGTRFSLSVVSAELTVEFEESL